MPTAKMFLADYANPAENIPFWNVYICVIMRDLREIFILNHVPIGQYDSFFDHNDTIFYRV